ncbi:glycosyltransferase family 2 protein [Microaerobacter geothermalis]|uniref:glycosyltransferase family 2 protein n=1 Tax=Microaerobacter geothermalis TaxID=674972 RepID=UPI001F322106|nr:glycosyltransferase family 2 protein [Microaerobacter geothermalis]MCF6093269.1 glycosyltransferase family 2 protein [Microaerobacter geothermalis]
MDLSILIVNYNTCNLTLQALRSVFDSRTDYQFEVIVIDNNSTDDSVEMIEREFPKVKLIQNRENVGFSKANNQGIKIADGRYILLLNSDTVIQKDTLDMMLKFMDNHPHIGASGCKVVLPDGSLDKACRRGFPTPSASFYYAFGIARLFPHVPRFNQYQLTYLDPDKDYPVDCLVGAFMLVRREAIEQVGLLDEEFFMYGEDIDWCYRIKQAGWDIYYYPYTSIVHYKGASSRRKPFKIIYEFHRAMFLFHRKHYQQKYSWAINGLVYLGIAVNFIFSLIINRLNWAR